MKKRYTVDESYTQKQPGKSNEELLKEIKDNSEKGKPTILNTPITEDDIRKIVREEFKKLTSKNKSTSAYDLSRINIKHKKP